MKKISKILFVLLVMSVFVFSLVLSANAATNAIGDVDGDGSIAAADARLALRASVGLEKLTDAQFKSADVNHDNTVTSSDARTILRVSVGLEEFEKNYTEEEQINQMQEFDDAFDEFFELEDIANLTESKKVQVIEEFLIDLSEKKTEDNAEPLIDADSVWYCEENGIVYFTYTSGIPSGVLVRQQDDMLASQSAGAAPKSVSSFGDSDELEAAITFGWGDKTDEDHNGYAYDDYVDLAKELSAYGIQATLYEYPTVEDYKTIFLNKEFIFIGEHGYNYYDENDNETYCCFAVYGDDVSYFEYIFDITMKNIYKMKDITLNGQKRDAYLITPRFFEHYYKDKLQGSIVAVGSCGSFGTNGNLNYSLAKAFYESCGADIVVGFHNPVYIAYSVAISKEFALNVLCGETYSDALSAAKEKCEDNDISYMYYIYALKDPDWWNNPEPIKGNKTGKQQVDEKNLQYGAAYPCVYGNTDHRFRPLCGSVAGVVKDKATQKAVANVTVEVLDKAGNVLSPTAVTDSTGSFQLKVPDGEYSLVFSCKGYETAKELVRFESGVETVLLDTVYLTPTSYLMGTVVENETNKPVEGASVLLQQIDEGGMIIGEYTGLTDTNGQFTINVPAGTYTYLIKCDKYENATGTVTVNKADGNILGTVYLISQPTATVFGTVQDKNTNEAIPYVTIQLINSDNVPAWTDITNENGEFVFDEKIPYGTYTIKFTHDNYSTSEYTIVIDAEEVEITELLVPDDTRPVTASGECGADGDNVIWTLYEDGNLVISGRGAMRSYAAHYGSSCPFNYNDSICSVTINDGVTSISAYAFFACHNLETIQISKDVTIIGHEAFGNTKWLKNQSDGLIYINNVLYYYKGKVPKETTIDIAKGTVSISESCFSYKRSSFDVIIPEGVKTIGYNAFHESGCKRATVPSTVEYIGLDAFSSVIEIIYGGTLLNWCNIPDVHSGSSLYNPYIDGKRLNGVVVIPKGVETIRIKAFAYCNEINSVVLNDEVTNIGSEAFSMCRNLESIVITKSVTCIEYRAFDYCDNLTDVYYLGTQEEWETITIGSGNECLTNATIHYNS